QRPGLSARREIPAEHAMGGRLLVRAQPGGEIPALLPERLPVRTRSMDFRDCHRLGCACAGARGKQRKASITMKITTKQTALVLTAPLQTSAACAAGAVAVRKLYEGKLKLVESEVVPRAEAMPDEKYGFRPSEGEFKDVRTFGQQV